MVISLSSIWYWHFFAFMFALLLSLPTALLVRFSKKLAVHQAIPSSQVDVVSAGDRVLEQTEWEGVIAAFNEANYLLKRPARPRYVSSYATISLKEKRGNYRLYLYAADVDVVRILGRKTTIYQIRSSPLKLWLQTQQPPSSSP